MSQGRCGCWLWRSENLTFGRSLSKIGVPCERFGSIRSGPLGVKFLEEAVAEPDGSNPEDDGEGLKSGLDDEPRSLLNFLNN